jgi:hypothetical protein
MRLHKVIPLDNTRSVLLKELHVRTARLILAQAKELKETDVKTLLTDRFDEIVALAGDCVSMPEGETIDDLTFSEVEEVIDGLMETNAAFLRLLGLVPKQTQQIPLTNSTEPASPSLSEVMST